MKFAMISGSQRKNSNTLKVAKHMQKLLKDILPSAEIFLLNLEEMPLPLWDDTLWDESSAYSHLWQPYAQHLQASQAFIVLSPEWSGMVPSALKNFFLYCSHKELGHKPALITTVSSGMGGSYPVNELRISSYKNTRLCYIPEHLIIRKVEDFLLDYESEQSEITRFLKQRMTYALRVLIQYAHALQTVRESGVVDHKQFPNGM